MTSAAGRLIAIGLCAVLPLSAAAQGVDLSRGKGTPVEIVARDGIEWNRDAQQYIARGDARATQGDTTVEAEVLTAYYREGASSRTEIFRYQADRDVRIFTPTHRAVGDRAIYDVDSGVMVLTGNKLKLTTPAEVITARDALEYWEQRQVAVARGDALAVTEDGRRMKADLLTAHFTDQRAGSGATQTTAPANRGGSPPSGKSDGENRRVQRIEAFGHVHISTEAEIAVGDRGVYNTETGIAVLAGNVKITRGQNQLNGDYAEVNTNTGISRLLSRPDPGGDNRVRGLFVPENENSQGGAKPAPSPSRGR